MESRGKRVLETPRGRDETESLKMIHLGKSFKSSRKALLPKEKGGRRNFDEKFCGGGRPFMERELVDGGESHGKKI